MHTAVVAAPVAPAAPAVTTAPAEVVAYAHTWANRAVRAAAPAKFLVTWAVIHRDANTIRRPIDQATSPVISPAAPALRIATQLPDRPRPCSSSIIER